MAEELEGEHEILERLPIVKKNLDVGAQGIRPHDGQRPRERGRPVVY
jgi:hypothetical protein